MIRFKIDVMKELKNKGFSANRLRKENILSESTMQNIRVAHKENANISINTKALNVICKILKKQPGQLLEYIPDTAPASDDQEKKPAAAPQQEKQPEQPQEIPPAPKETVAPRESVNDMLNRLSEKYNYTRKNQE